MLSCSKWRTLRSSLLITIRWHCPSVSGACYTCSCWCGQSLPTDHGRASGASRRGLHDLSCVQQHVPCGRVHNAQISIRSLRYICKGPGYWAPIATACVALVTASVLVGSCRRGTLPPALPLPRHLPRLHNYLHTAPEHLQKQQVQDHDT